MDQTTSAPRVEPGDIERAITNETYTVLPDGRTTVCQLTLYNGFTVEGFSACVSIENFNPELGNKYSRERAVEKVWQFLGFRLSEELYRNRFPNVHPEVVEECTSKPLEIGDQVFYFEQVEGKVFAPMPAIVTSILDQGHVALTVFAPNGSVHARERVFLMEPGMQSIGLTVFAKRHR